MKKLLVALLALMAVGAFAQTPAVSGSSTLQWAIDLNTSQTGFTNTNVAAITVPFAVANAKKTGEGTYGEISLSNITFKIKDGTKAGGDGLTFIDTDADGNAPTFAAKIVSGPFTVAMSSGWSMTWGKADPIDNLLTGTDTANQAFDADSAGTKITYSLGDMGSVGFVVGSNGDHLTNVDNEYAAGVVLALTPAEMFGVNFGFGYDVVETTKDMGGYVTLPITLGGLTLEPAVDFVLPDGGTFAFDASVSLGYDLTETAAASLYFYYGDDMNVEVTFADDSGFVDGLAFDVTVDAILAAATSWAVEFNASYKSMIDETYYVKPYLTVATDDSSALDLNVGVEAKLFANTVLTADYDAADIANDKGIFLVKAKVSF